MNIKELIEKEESETLEFKKSTAQLERALKSICGFLNHKGGIIYFGVEKNGKIIGQTISDQPLRSVSQKIRQRIRPEISFGIKVLEIEEKRIIEVKIKEGGVHYTFLTG